MYEAAVAEQTGRRASGVVAAAAPGRLLSCVGKGGARDVEKLRRRLVVAPPVVLLFGATGGRKHIWETFAEFDPRLGVLFIHFSIRSRNRQSGAPVPVVLLWATGSRALLGNLFLCTAPGFDQHDLLTDITHKRPKHHLKS